MPSRRRRRAAPRAGHLPAPPEGRWTARRPAGKSCGGAADGEAVHAQRGLTDADRHLLPVLAAGADAVIEPQIIADHADLGEGVGTIADERRALDGGADLPVFDEIGFRGREDEFAGGDVDLSAAEIDGV